MLSDGRLKILAAPRPGPVTSYAYWLIKARPNPRPDVLTAARWIEAQAEADDTGDESVNAPKGFKGRMAAMTK